MLSLGAVAAGARGVGNGGFGHVLLMCGMCVVGARLGKLCVCGGAVCVGVGCRSGGGGGGGAVDVGTRGVGGWGWIGGGRGMCDGCG